MSTFWDDLKRKELLPIKTLMFLIYGGQATLYPYFTVHLKSLGISIEQTTIIFAIQPIIALVVAPMVGMMADKIGNFKFLFCFFLVFSAITSNCLLTVPEIAYSTDYGKLFMKMSCANDASSQSELQILKNSSCLLQGNNLTSLELEITKCESASGTAEDCSSDGDTASCCLQLNETAVTVDGTHLGNDTIYVNRYVYMNNSCSRLICPGCDSIYFAKTKGNSEVCKEKREKIESSEAKTFWTYLGIRLMVTLGAGMVNGLFDSASMAVVMKYEADIGYQRLWATAAMCVFAPISGYLADITGGNYKPCFYLYGTLYLFAAVVSLFVDLSMKLPSQNAFKNLQKLLSNPEVAIMLLHVGVLGICWGFLENFLFWFLESELKSSNLLMGLTVTVGSGTGLPMSLVSTWVTMKIGYVNVMVLAFAAYCVRYIGYSFATDAYICLIYEMMENFTVTLLTIGVTLYCTYLAPLEMLTTMMTLWNGLHVVSGRAFGSLIGGFLMARIGARRTFRLFAYSSAFFCFFYFFINIFYLKRRKKPKKVEEEDEKEMERIRTRALSISSVIVNYSTDAVYIPRVNMESIMATRCRRHTYSPSLKQHSLSDIQPRKRRSQSLSFEPMSNPSLPMETRRHIARRVSCMSYTSHLEPVPEEQSKCSSTEDFSLVQRGEPEGSENPPAEPTTHKIIEDETDTGKYNFAFTMGDDDQRSSTDVTRL